MLLASHFSLIVIESREETRVLSLVKEAGQKAVRGRNWGVFQWTVTEGLRRVDIDLGGAQRTVAEPTQLLRHLKATTAPGIYVLLDFHPYLEDPINVRMLKDIAQGYEKTPRTLVFLSHEVTLPQELEHLTARLKLGMPTRNERAMVVHRVAQDWQNSTGRAAKIDDRAFEHLVDNLSGLESPDTERLARQAIFNDGALIDGGSAGCAGREVPASEPWRHAVIRTGYSEVRGHRRARPSAPVADQSQAGIRRQRAEARCAEGRDVARRAGLRKKPRGNAQPPAFSTCLCYGWISARSTASGTAESEKNLRESLRAAEALSPCVLWVDEMEKALAAGMATVACHAGCWDVFDLAC